MRGGPAESLIQQTYGNLTVLSRRGAIGRNPAWLCRCTCGVEVIVRSDRLKLGKRKSCARNKHYWVYPRNTLGRDNAAEYSSWRSMRDRCAAKTGKHYRNYAALGVTVCARWDSFAAFLADMGKKPDRTHTIDRHPNPHGNYEPSNCRWATSKEQSRNKRNSHYVTYRGKRMLLVELAERVLLHPKVLRGRLKMGWSIDKAVTKAVRRRRKNRKKPLDTRQPPALQITT